METINVDIIIFGGGIAGLYALNQLHKANYSVLLLENNTLGSGQTIKSQGIIHGGIKYALQGILNSSANKIASMPMRWKACLEGLGDIDLGQVNILSQDQLLWSNGQIKSDLLTFFASKALSSRVKKLKNSEFPTIFQQPHFKGQVFRLNEIVLDIPSLLNVLREQNLENIFKVDSKCIEFLMTETQQTPAIRALQLNVSDKKIKLQAKHYLLTTGESNLALSQQFKQNVAMQTRPLHMVMVKLKDNYPLFAHSIDHGMNPRMTITSHFTKTGELVWYLGGQLAEDGVHKTKREQCQFAKQELMALFPWLDFRDTLMTSFFINRAEKELAGKRPESVSLQTNNNVTTAWPTKLALAPLLADQFMIELDKQKVRPMESAGSQGVESAPITSILRHYFPVPEVATPIWDELVFEQF